MDKIKEKIEQYRPAAALLLVLIAAIYYLSTRGNNGDLAASGTIEAAEVNLASEVGGLVEDVLAKEGDQVSEDAVLVRFDGAFLKARLKQAQASLALAQANYEQIAAQVELQVTAAEQDLAGLYDNEDVARAKASQAVADARDALRDAQIRLSNLNTINNPED
ncbi:MAG: biotin/lipoyl-binding protein, partial [Anaerolineae bacterium]|nr:biotin/lipoyl-binding protein [Anaerolineae bacterium]